MPMTIAILDDHAGVAMQLADWSGLGAVSVFHDTLRDEDAPVARLEPFALFYGDTLEAIRAWQAGEPVRVLAAP